MRFAGHCREGVGASTCVVRAEAEMACGVCGRQRIGRDEVALSTGVENGTRISYRGAAFRMPGHILNAALSAMC